MKLTMLDFSSRDKAIVYTALFLASISFVRSFQVGGHQQRHCREWEPARREHGAAPYCERRHLHFQTKLGVRIREWREEDVEQIQSLLSDSQQTDFDPEGSLEIDCGSAAAIQESYNDDEGGCFLVATEVNSDSKILGTAALIVGTQIAYLKSGASISTPTLTGAVRRFCTVEDTDIAQSKESVLNTLLQEIETRATQSGATDLIILAYPSSRRPTAALLEGRGYQALPAKLPGVDAVQYGKALGGNSNANTDVRSSSNALSDVAIGTLFVTGLLVAVGFVANTMGLEILSSADNRGIGTPLSIEELQRLKEDEQLQRTDLDGEQRTRQWEDLGNEERREEAALMRIIQGQDIRQR